MPELVTCVLKKNSSFTDQRTCEVNKMGENNSFICIIKTVPVYDFKLVWVVLHPLPKNFSEGFTNKSKTATFYLLSPFS